MLERDLNPIWDDPEDFDEDAWADARQEKIDALADRLIDEIKCGDITDNQARARMTRAMKRGT